MKFQKENNTPIDTTECLPEIFYGIREQLLSSTDIVQKIDYNNNQKTYTTFMPASTEVLKLTSMQKK